MPNQTVWDYANKVGAKMLFPLDWISFGMRIQYEMIF